MPSTSNNTQPPSEAESEELRAREARLELLLSGPIGVGRELEAIHARRLYRAQYANFEAFIWEKYRIKRPTGYRWLNGARQVDQLISQLPSPTDPQQEAFLNALKRHGDVKAIKLLVKDVPASRRLEVYRRAWQKGSCAEPDAKAICHAAQELGIVDYPRKPGTTRKKRKSSPSRDRQVGLALAS